VGYRHGRRLSSHSRAVGFACGIWAQCRRQERWWVARNHAVSADRLHTLGLLYQVACFTLALTSFWQSYLQKGIFPSLT
jgi:hypothetical protein